MNYKAMQNDISTGGSKEGDAGERGVHAFRLHVLNHTFPLKPKTNSSRLKGDIEGQWKRGGGDLFLSECLLPEEVGRRNRGNQSRCWQPTLHEALS